MTTKKKLKNIKKKKRKFAHSSTNTTGFISKAVREIYPSLRNKPAESSELKKAVQVGRWYQSYIDIRQLIKMKIFLTLLILYRSLYV